jgi:MFS transporter, SHS family, lactate transporter
MDLTSTITTTTRATPGWQLAVSAAILGWILDAFNFFVVIFLFGPLANNFHVSHAAVVFTLTVTLAMRPVGALIFGALADRFGRKRPLIACVLFFTLFTILSGYSPNYVSFLVMRGLYGIGMGGYWGIGASYAMESSPLSKRGFVSGLMQGGYPFGYLLAAIAMQAVVPFFGWRAMFVVGCGVAVIIIAVTLLAPESDSWKVHRSPELRGIFRLLVQNARVFSYILLLMTAMNCLSHGTQDLYPDFLRSVTATAGKTMLGMKMIYGIPIIYNIGAVAGAIFFGQLSERIGRRRAIMLALMLCLVSIPAWAFGTSLLLLTFGSYFMQTGVQGAFGVIPAHLNELSPDAIRSLFPGFVYQLGVLLASPSISFEYLLRNRLGYPWALTIFEIFIIISLLFLFGFGPERLGRSFHLREERSGTRHPLNALPAATQEASLLRSRSVEGPNS